MFYQDVNEQFEGYTQPTDDSIRLARGCFIRMSMNNLKDIHNPGGEYKNVKRLFYQDVNEQFEGYTQRLTTAPKLPASCFIRMSMNNLKDIHNMLIR